MSKTFYCKCGKEIKKSSTAACTRNEDLQDSCKGCVYIESGSTYRKGVSVSIKYCQAGSKKPNHTVTYSTSDENNSTTLDIIGLDMDVFKTIGNYAKELPGCTSKSGDSFLSIDREDCRKTLVLAFEQNKKGIAAKQAIINKFFVDKKYNFSAGNEAIEVDGSFNAEDISWLTTVPVGDPNWKSVAGRASLPTLQEALNRINKLVNDGITGHKSRIVALQSAINKLKKLDNNAPAAEVVQSQDGEIYFPRCPYLSSIGTKDIQCTIYASLRGKHEFNSRSDLNKYLKNVCEGNFHKCDCYVKMYQEEITSTVKYIQDYRKCAFCCNNTHYGGLINHDGSTHGYCQLWKEDKELFNPETVCQWFNRNAQVLKAGAVTDRNKCITCDYCFRADNAIMHPMPFKCKNAAHRVGADFYFPADSEACSNYKHSDPRESQPDMCKTCASDDFGCVPGSTFTDKDEGCIAYTQKADDSGNKACPYFKGIKKDGISGKHYTDCEAIPDSLHPRCLSYGSKSEAKSCSGICIGTGDKFNDRKFCRYYNAMNSIKDKTCADCAFFGDRSDKRMGNSNLYVCNRIYATGNTGTTLPAIKACKNFKDMGDEFMVKAKCTEYISLGFASNDALEPWLINCKDYSREFGTNKDRMAWFNKYCISENGCTECQKFSSLFKAGRKEAEDQDQSQGECDESNNEITEEVIDQNHCTRDCVNNMKNKCGLIGVSGEAMQYFIKDINSGECKHLSNLRVKYLKEIRDCYYAKLECPAATRNCAINKEYCCYNCALPCDSFCSHCKDLVPYGLLKLRYNVPITEPGKGIPVDFDNPEPDIALDSHLQFIRKKSEDIVGNYVEIGFTLVNLRDNKLFKAKGYDSLVDCVEAELNMKKSTCYNLIKVAEKFGDPDTKRLASEYSKYNYVQCLEMATMTEVEISQVNPDMSKRDMKRLKDSNRLENKKSSSFTVDPSDENIIDITDYKTVPSNSSYVEITTALPYPADDKDIEDVTHTESVSILDPKTVKEIDNKVNIVCSCIAHALETIKDIKTEYYNENEIAMLRYRCIDQISALLIDVENLRIEKDRQAVKQQYVILIDDGSNELISRIATAEKKIKDLEASLKQSNELTEKVGADISEL